MKIVLKVPKQVIFNSNTEALPYLEEKGYGRMIYEKTVMQDPLCDSANTIINNHDTLVEAKYFGSNKKSTIKKKGFDKYSTETGKTRAGLKISVQMQTITK